MAKKKSSSPRGTQGQGSSSVNTNSFTKGMNKDVTPSFESKESWWHARNVANNSEDGDLGIIGNEPSNLLCGVIPYTVIGAIHRYGDEWIIYSTDNINSEIGTFDDSECKYTALVNDQCLNFNKKFLITGASKENFDCTWQVYWDDGNNPSRTLNIDKIPWKQEQITGPDINGSDCVEFADIIPRTLNCEKIRLAPLVDTPCVEITQSVDSGQVANGAYQAFIAYTENEQKVGDYIGISNIQTIFSHLGTNGSLDISVSNLDEKYDYYELVILRRNQGQTSAKKIGLYSTQQKKINIDYIDEALVAIDLVQIPLMSPAYEKSESMFVVNDWLIRQGPVEQFDFNYQPIANDIKVEWVTNSVPSNYYHKGGNKYNFLRDEQYAFFIRWIYNTGERSSSYHIPGRAPEVVNIGGVPYSEDQLFSGDNVLNTVDGEKLFKVYNTATVESTAVSQLPDGSTITSRGKMGFWESTERYPNEPDIWGDLCGKFIRHHKMPTEETGPSVALSNTGDDLINLLGVQFNNIGRPKYNDGTYIPNVVGYELLKGSRLGAKSILGKGLFRNMRKYKVPNPEDLIGNGVQGLYPNHPYNDLRPDVYFQNGTNDKLTNGCDNFGDSIDRFKPLGFAGIVDGEQSGYSQSVFTFSSPDLNFTKPFLNAYETRLYGQISGRSSGYFIPSEDHPKQKIIRGIAAFAAAIIGFGYAIHQLRGTTGKNATSNSTNLSSTTVKGEEIIGRRQGGGGGFITLTVPPGVATVNLNNRNGGEISGGDFQGPWDDRFDDYIDAARNEAIRSGEDSGTLMNASGTIDLAPESGAQGGFGLAGLADLYAGASGTDNAEQRNADNNAEDGAIPGVQSGKVETSKLKDTNVSNLPRFLRVVTNILSMQTNIAIAGNEIIDGFYNSTDFRDYMWKYNSDGQFTDFTPVSSGLWRIKNEDSNYIGSSFQTFDNGKYKINNLFRPNTVAVSLSKNIDDPTVQDNSRFVVGGSVNADGTDSPHSDGYFLSPGKDNPRSSNISGHYGALKFNFDNQYGQLSGIKQIPMRGCVELLDPEKPLAYLYSSQPIFAGDTFVGRYTEKNIMPIYTRYLLGQPDGFTFDYALYVNIPYPRYWMNSQRFDITNLARAISSLGLSGIFGGWDDIVPNDLYYLDRGENSCSDMFDASTWNGDDPNGFFEMRYAYGYTHTNGILDFYTESDVNLANRDWEDEPKKRIYEPYDYNDVDELFHAKIEKADNFYKYDDSLSPSKFPTQMTSFGLLQPLDYDPITAEECFVNYPKRLIYSLQAQEESKKDFWRVFLQNNYKDFKNDVSVIKPINKNGALIFFPHLSPQMFQGLDTLKTQLNTKLTIGDGGLFSQPFQNVANADLSNEYGSSESLRGVINTPLGLFFISQAQGKIFQYGGKGLDPISNQGMKWWFAKYLPSKFIKQFPNSEKSVWSDNPVAGVGCHVIYDSVDDIVYFMKKDYQLKPQYIAGAEFTNSITKPVIITLGGLRIPIDIGDPIYFDDCSWTVSYDPKAKAWISFHDWHPGLALPSINHFFTTNQFEDLDNPQCPPGYTFNPVNGLCEISINETELSEVTVDNIAATVTGGATNCLLDIVIAMDVSGSTTPGGPPQYIPMQFIGGNQVPGTGVMGDTQNATAQLRWLDVFMNSPEVTTALAAGTMQIGTTMWANNSTQLLQGTVSMSNTATGVSLCNLYTAAWPGGGGTNADNAIFGSGGVNNPLGGNGGLAMLNNKAASSLSASYPARTQDPSFKQILIVVTDGTAGTQATQTANGTPQYQSPLIASGAQPNANTGNWASGANQSALIDLQDSQKQEIYAVYCGSTNPVPGTSALLDSISNSTYNAGPGPNQYTMAANNNNSLLVSATAIAGDVCSTPFVCECPTGYTLVYPDPTTSTYSSATGTCTDDPVERPICRKVECECPPATVPGTVITELGTCPDSAPLIYQIGDPNFVQTDPAQCNYFYYVSTQANYVYGGIWRHNVRCDSFANYYTTDYPWEIDLISNTGQSVNTIRSFEYQLETYVYKGDPQYNMCGGDKWEDLDFNFDASIIYNNDQVSGLLVLNPQPVNNPWNNLTYPIVNLNSIDVLVSKVEHKFRFNQFWDITNDRGEFTNVEQSIFNTESNGYIRPLNTLNLNYQKSPTQRKKFRHYSNNLILRRNVSGNRKMLLRLNNTKLLLSQR